MKVRGLLREAIHGKLNEWHEENRLKRKFDTDVKRNLIRKRSEVMEKLAEEKAEQIMKTKYANYGKPRDWAAMANRLSAVSAPTKTSQGEKIFETMDEMMWGKRKKE